MYKFKVLLHLSLSHPQVISNLFDFYFSAEHKGDILKIEFFATLLCEPSL